MTFFCSSCRWHDKRMTCELIVPDGVVPKLCHVHGVFAPWKIADCTEQQVQPDNSPKMCEECGEYPADLPSNLCCGCDAYKEHLS